MKRHGLLHQTQNICPFITRTPKAIKCYVCTKTPTSYGSIEAVGNIMILAQPYLDVWCDEDGVFLTCRLMGLRKYLHLKFITLRIIGLYSEDPYESFQRVYIIWTVVPHIHCVVLIVSMWRRPAPAACSSVAQTFWTPSCWLKNRALAHDVRKKSTYFHQTPI